MYAIYLELRREVHSCFNETITKELSVCKKLKYSKLIPIFLQPGGVNLWHFKLGLFYLKVYDIGLQS